MTNTATLQPHAQRGAALIVVIGMLSILLVIAATILVSTQEELQTSTNRSNSVRADLLADGAIAVAQAFLNYDLAANPTITSIDSAWRTYFNGAWAAGKPWMWGGGDINNDGLPDQVDDFLVPPLVDLSLMPLFLAGTPLFSDPLTRGWLYVPRLDFTSDPTAAANLGILAGNPFVLPADTIRDPVSGVVVSTRAEQVDMWADIDNDLDGLKDSVWLPIGAHRFFPADGVDNDLDGLIDGADLDGEAGIFIYWGGDDGEDNDDDGETDEPDENAWFTTVPDPFIDARGNPVAFDWTLAGVPGVHGTTTIRADLLDNDFTSLVNDGTDASHFMNTDAARAAYGGFLFSLRGPDIDGNIVDGQILAEPVSELVGRMAILITDESSKVNLNIAGGLTFNDFPNIEFAPLGPPLALTHAFNRGVSAHEYDLRVLPNVGTARSDRLWTVRMGSPDGLAFGSADHVRLDPDDPSFAGFAHDISLPGYGLVDDNGNALWLAMNGIDDDGNGFIDDGLIAYDYDGDGFTELALLEGIDEPDEFQQYIPLRNLVAEFDGLVDNDNDGVVDEIGELGDRVFRTLEEIKLSLKFEIENFELVGRPFPQNANTFTNDLRRFVTVHSVDKGDRNLHSRDGRTILPPSRRRVSGLRQDYNLARAGDVAERLKEDFGYPISEPFIVLTAAQDPDGLIADEIRAYARGLRREDVDISVADPTVELILGGTASLFPGDAALRAQQLAANIADAADIYFSRTEVTTSLPDVWWNNLSSAADIYRHITYTSSGIEAIRINEIMVRPTRRIEAESTMDPGLPNLNPNIYSGTGDPDFDMSVLFTDPTLWPTLPFADQSLLGLQSVIAVYDAYAGPGPGPDPLNNIAVFSFAESRELPAGNYYLMLNTTHPGGFDPSVLETTDFEFTIGIGPLADAFALANDPFFLADWRSPAVLGRDAFGNLTGWAFLQNQNFGHAGFTVTVPPAVSGLMLHVGIRKSPSVSDPLTLNFFEFSQEPDHEWVELINVAQGGESIDLSGWQLVVEGPARRIMTIPNGTFIAPRGMLLLGLNKYDEFEGAAQGFDFIFENGIGLASGSIPRRGRFGDTYLNVTAPPYISFDGSSVFVNSTGFDFVDNFQSGPSGDSDLFLPPSTFDPQFANSRIAPQLKAWDRIVEMYSTDIRNLDTAEAIGTLVLAGGIFPNYPEQDGIDNDSDAGLLEINGYDDDGDGAIDEDGLDPNTVREGIDEGRYRLAANAFDANVAIPGSFTELPVRFLADDFNFDPAVNKPYLGSALDPPEWKEFVERRNFPGDNVVVTLYQGPAFARRVVDRITYTQRDVANRAIDDIIPIPPSPFGGFARELLNINNITFWPENTMGIDFYRSLERKHPLYAGDRFGTQDRFQATDGNYDDWAPSTSRFARIMDRTGTAPLGILDRLDIADPITATLVGHTINGSPLRMNYSQRLIENPNGQFDTLIPDPDPQAIAYDQLVRWTFDRARVRNRTLVSPGELLSLPHFHRRDVMSFTVPPQDGETINQSRQLFLGSEDTWRRDYNTREAMLGQHFAVDRSSVIGNGGAISPLTLTVGQATVYPMDSVVQGRAPIKRWGQTLLGVPEAWVPVLLFGVDGDAPRQRVGLGDYWIKYLMNTPATLPFTVTQERWPLERRATMYVSGNFEGFDPFGAPHSGGHGAEALFVWDGEDGLETGEYDVFLAVGESLQRLAAAHANYSVLTTANTVRDAGPNATDIGVSLVGIAGNSAAREMMVDVEVFTDLDGDRRVWATNTPTLHSDLNRGTGGFGIRESFGEEHGLMPGPDGIVHYGVVRVRNNFLAVLLRNRAGPGRVNRFSRVILAPRNKTRGRINVNTVVTQRFDDGPNDFFNPLMGLPGVLSRIPDNENIFPSQPRYQATQQFASKITANRGLRETPAGRYYELPSDLVVPIFDSIGNVVIPLNFAINPNVNPPTLVFDEHRDRYERLANTITTRSDVFEIIVTVQSGYGVDSNGDGRVNYRSDFEFVSVAEKKVRTVYER